jgi:exopolysaccharide biosynthesis polyprenyl glycosylphosphotransferase
MEAEPASSSRAAAPPTPRETWLDRYSRRLVALDGVALLTAGLLALAARFGLARGNSLNGLSYVAIAAVLALAWLAVLALSRCYESRFLGAGPEEFRRVGNASLRVTAVVAFVAYAFQLDLSRGFVAVLLLAGTALLLLARAGARGYIRRQRRSGRFLYRVLVVGGPAQAEELASALSRDPQSGMQVVGACVSGSARHLLLPTGATVPVVGTVGSVVRAVREVAADIVAVAASPGLTGEALRRLSYELEGAPVDLVVAPALTNVTGSRLHIRPMAGLPLLHLDEPELSGARKGAKLLFDLVVALVAVVVLAPVLLAIALVVRATSPGPALFTQDRVGRNGTPFRVYKFRSMYIDAERRLADIRHLNEHDGVLFKVRNDPRITPVGRWLRTHSLDELPQLFNVLRGDMSLVGPRPPLRSEVARYEGHAHRRLLVRPGITGLWQVSGRSDLSWDDTVRLDLQYVENWSLALDIAVLLRTAKAVFDGRGAY